MLAGDIIAKVIHDIIKLQDDHVKQHHKTTNENDMSFPSYDIN